MFQIGLENNTEGRSQAWVLGHPGCFAYGGDGSGALEAVPQAIRDYRQWIAVHTSESWLSGTDIERSERSEYRLVETWECYSISSDFEIVQDGYEVNAWFRHDWIPLTEEDIRRGLRLLSWSREDLMKIVSNLSTEILERTYPKERWNISGILKHIAGAEWWYLDRLGLADLGKYIEVVATGTGAYTGTVTSAPTGPVNPKPKPSITKIYPTSGNMGSTISVYGNNFGSSRGSSYVKFGKVKAITYSSWTNTKIRVKVPSGLYKAC